MITKIQIKSYFGSVLFEYESEDNSVKKTLVEAVKRGADLKGADLRGADLRGADLRGADLKGADLQGADLRGVKNPPEAMLDVFRKDLLYVIIHSPIQEVKVLRQKIVEGKINGSQYEGECCCLIGTLSKADNKDSTEFCQTHIPYYTKGLDNPSEQLFWQIKEGDKPEDNQFSQIALEVIDTFLLEWGSKEIGKQHD